MQTTEERPLTSKEAAQRAGVSTVHVTRLIRKGSLQAQRFGEVWLISSQSLQQYLMNRPRRGRPATRRA